LDAEKNLLKLSVALAFAILQKALRHLMEREMSKLTAVEAPRKANTDSERGVPTNQTTKVLSNRECPSCFQKGSMELFIRNLGEYTLCFSCGHREISFYR
jgi:hypothetical protein